MKSLEELKFPTLLRQPDLVLGATEESSFRFEERANWASCPIPWEYRIVGDTGEIVIHPCKEPVKFLKLRWHGDLSHVESVLGDEWERITATHAPVEWRSVMPYRPLPWYCLVRGEGNTVGYGVKTGCDCFAFFQVDTHGVTLFLNLTCGAGGTLVPESFTACRVTELANREGESVYETARRFMGLLCDAPVLPKEPVFGVNNWYWAYGNISREIVLRETDCLMEMTDGVKHRPCMIIDDGWQLNRIEGPGLAYHGGPFAFSNPKFPDMSEVAGRIREKGARPGLWMRPLLTLGDMPREAMLRAYSRGVVMDPSHPYTLERVREDAARIRSWGFEILKHDFTSNDAMGVDPFRISELPTQLTADGKVFFDRTKTSATILKNLYKAIQEGIEDGDVIGCGVVGHLSAGIHSIHRTGSDTSGRSFEWTVRNGVHAFMRLPMNDTFFRVDPDCAAFTDQVDARYNLDFMEACARTGSATIASVTPGILTDSQMQRINRIYRLADRNVCRDGIVNYEKTAIPERFLSQTGEETVYHWAEAYDGSRAQITWLK